MKKPDYKNFILHLREWNKYNIVYSLRDMCKLAFKYCCPIPKDILFDNVRRDDLVEKLSYKWREAENIYLETGQSEFKEKLLEVQRRLHLNEPEYELLYGLCNSMGV